MTPSQLSILATLQGAAGAWVSNAQLHLVLGRRLPPPGRRRTSIIRRHIHGIRKAGVRVEGDPQRRRGWRVVPEQQERS